MSNYAKNLAASVPNRTHTPQTEAIPGREAEMAQNNAGGFSFIVSPWDMLDRFLVLGTEGGTYYTTERKMTKENATNVLALIKTDGLRVVARVVEISDAGRAPKNDPALFVLAMASAADDERVRKAALDALPKVARIGTHIHHFSAFIEGFRGWGRSLRKAIANWYLEMPVDRLAMNAIKYSSRDGWSNRDLLRLSHPKTSDVTRNTIFKWIAGQGIDGINLADLHPLIAAFEQAKVATDENEIVRLILDHNLPREAIPTQFLNSPKIWEALLQSMPMTAMIRNLAKMTSIGLISNQSASKRKIVEQLSNQEALRKARVHPIAILSAMTTYQSGHGVKGSLTWTPSRKVVDALDSSFYLSFGNVESTNKPTLLALDVSGSMGSPVLGLPNLDCRTAAAAFALVTLNVEPNADVVGFTSSGWSASGSKSRGGWGYSSGGIEPLNISSKQRLDDVVRYMQRLSFGGTDCSLPFIYAKAKNLRYESVAVFTDSETYAGAQAPSQALRDYRQALNIPTRSAVVAFTSNGFTIADPKDKGMLDCCGIDASLPQILTNFFKGE